MRVGRRVVRWVGSLIRRRWAEEELEREVALHLEQLQKQYAAEGMSEREAWAAALREFGPVEVTKELCREARGVSWLEDAARDAAYAVRMFRKSPGFTLTAVVSLALGIGANTVVFSVVNGLLLRPLPVREPDRVVFVNNGNGPSNSFPNYRALRDRNRAFASLFSYRTSPMAIEGAGGAQRVWGYLATGNYFQSLGISPALGRFFTPAEDVHKNGEPYAVLSYSCWQNRFGGDRGIVGKAIRINGQPYTVLGVAPRGFHGTEVFYWAEIWVPMMMEPRIESFDWLEEPNTFNTWIAGRLKTGVTKAQAEADLGRIAAQLAGENKVNEGMRLTVSTPGLAGRMGRGATRTFTAVVMLLAGLVLLAACTNLAVLLAARTSERGRDLAIRVSMGAGRGRVARQLLTESVVLALAGGAAGCAVAVELLRLLSKWKAPLDFPVQMDVTADWRVFLFALGVTAATGVLFGIAPARRAWRTDPALSFKGGMADGRRRRWAAGEMLLPVEVALCSVLVTTGLVAAQGMARSLQAPLGFKPDGVAAAGYDVSLAGYDKARGNAFEKKALEAVEQIPGVESAAYGSTVPLSIDQSTTSVDREGTTDFRPKNSFRANYYEISPGYLHTIGARLVAGREFDKFDREGGPRVAVVNETFARRVVGTVNAVGRRFLWGPGMDMEIVGVVEDGKYTTLTEDKIAAVFIPVSQSYTPTVVLVARSRRPESEVAGEMRRALAGLDPGLAVYGVGGLREMLGLVYLPVHAAVITLASFGLLAMMLAVTGIYGLSAFSVSRRRKEIGIRMAVGAGREQVLRFVFERIGVLVGVGAAVGLALGLASARMLGSVVYGATARDPWVIFGTVCAMAAAGVMAAYGPARRAVKVDPVECLRWE